MVIETCPRKFKPFVSVQVAESQETIDPEEFHFVKSSHSPTDALFRIHLARHKQAKILVWNI